MISYDDIQSVFSSATFAQHFGLSREQAKELSSRACDLLDAGAFEEAAVMFEGLVVMNHRDPGNWVRLGIAYTEAQRKEEAKQVLETALRLQPDHAIAKKYLARVS
jgi:Flp pilus assembly protein TadD